MSRASAGTLQPVPASQVPRATELWTRLEFESGVARPGSGFRVALGKLLQKEEGEPKTDVEAQHIKTMMNSEHKQLQAASVTYINIKIDYYFLIFCFQNRIKYICEISIKYICEIHKNIFVDFIKYICEIHKNILRDFCSSHFK